jgi:4-amino-4-deoxychorismate lyase
VTRGDGCFEGIRVIPGPDDATPDNLDAHLARMARSAAALEVPFDAAAWRALVETACRAWTADGEGAMKLLLTRGAERPAGWCRIVPVDPAYARLRRDGLRAVTLARGIDLAALQDAPWLLGGIKTLSYAVNMAAQREAVRRGADEVIFVAADGTVLEAPTASVVWAVGRTLHTTPVEGTGILAGTTQQRLFERASGAGWTVADTRAQVCDLHAADALWVISAVRGPVEVIELDGARRARRPDLTAEITKLAGFAVQQ